MSVQAKKMKPAFTIKKLYMGVSTCLLGEPVRYDGGHARDRYVTDTLGQYMAFVPVCPEMDAGLGLPREPIRLEGNPDSPKVLTINTRKDLTDTMTRCAQRRLRELEKEDLCGFIFKSKSPSSGMERVKVYNEKGIPVKKGVGVFARAFMEYFPLIPVEEDGRLHDPHVRENFIERIFTLNRWRQARKKKPSAETLVRFHTRHKLLIRSHSTRHYREMEKRVADVNGKNITETFRQYETLLMEALHLKATIKKHTHVLHHMVGYLKARLTADEKQELLGVIDDFQKGLSPLIVPVTLFKHYIIQYGQPSLIEEFYLSPNPIELKLRNRV